MINIEYSIFIVVNYTLHMKARCDAIWSQINICSSFPNLFIIKSDTINAIPFFNVEKMQQTIISPLIAKRKLRCW